MSVKRRVLAVAATLTIAAGVITVGTLSASAATPACDGGCISIFSREVGTYAQPNVVEAVLQGVAKVGQPVILRRASSSDPTEDLIVPRAGLVSDFYAVGMVSAEANSKYSHLRAAQIEYSPFGVRTGLCVGVATIASQTEGLTLQPCSVSAVTVWIVDTADSPTTAADGYFPLVNGSTTDFSRPFAMHYPRDELATDQRIQQIQVRHLQFLTDEHTLPDSQLWGIRFGVLN